MHYHSGVRLPAVVCVVECIFVACADTLDDFVDVVGMHLPGREQLPKPCEAIDFVKRKRTTDTQRDKSHSVRLGAHQYGVDHHVHSVPFLYGLAVWTALVAVASRTVQIGPMGSCGTRDTGGTDDSQRCWRADAYKAGGFPTTHDPYHSGPCWIDHADPHYCGYCSLQGDEVKRYAPVFPP